MAKAKSKTKKKNLKRETTETEEMANADNEAPNTEDIFNFGDGLSGPVSRRTYKRECKKEGIVEVEE